MGDRRWTGGIGLSRMVGRRGTRDAPGHRRRLRRGKCEWACNARDRHGRRRWPVGPGPWSAIPVAEQEFPASLIELSKQADYTVLISPETTGILANLTRNLEQAGARTLGCSAASVELAGNKARLAEWLEARGIPTPRSRTVVPAEGLPKSAGGPWVLKPIDGAGAIDTFFLMGTDDLPDSARQITVVLLQPFLTGIPMSASFLIEDANVAWLIAMGQQKITIRGGRFRYEGGTLPVPCREAEPVLRRGCVGQRPARVRRRRLSLGCERGKGDRARDQPTADDVLRGAHPTLAAGMPGSVMAGLLRRAILLGGACRHSPRS